MVKRINKVVFIIVGAWLFGAFGADRFMRGQIGLGVLKLLTGGGAGVWYLVDFILSLVKLGTVKGEDYIFVNGQWATEDEAGKVNVNEVQHIPWSRFSFTVKHLVATAIGAAIFFLLARFLSVPVFANTFLTLQYAVLGFFAAVFGPIVGMLIGLIGHFFTDLTFGWGLWWSWIIASAVVGFASGFILKPGSVEEGLFSGFGIVRFIIGSLLVHGVSWGLIAPVLDILIYAEPANRVFTQGIIAGSGNFVLTAVVGTALIFAYSKTRTKSDSLD